MQNTTFLHSHDGKTIDLSQSAIVRSQSIMKVIDVFTSVILTYPGGGGISKLIMNTEWKAEKNKKKEKDKRGKKKKRNKTSQFRVTF